LAALLTIGLLLLPDCAKAIGDRAPRHVAIVIVVRDARTHEALAGARVFLSEFDNPTYHRVKITGANGIARFTRFPYDFLTVRASKAGYIAQHAVLRVRVGEQGADVAFVLRPLHLKTIARVVSRPSIRYRYFSQNSKFAPLFRDLIAQMNALGGANIVLSSAGTLNGISLEGMDPSMTSTSFDGVEVQSADALNSIDVDALQRASVDLNSASAKLYSLSPSPVLDDNDRSRVGGIGDTDLQLERRDTIGKVGFAVEGALRTARSALDGETYTDTSGFTYKHTGGFVGGLGAIAATWNLGGGSLLTAKYLRHLSTTAPLSIFESGSIPQGYGPFPVSMMDGGSIGELTLSRQVGAWSGWVTLSDFSTHGYGNFSNAYVAGAPAPSLSTTLSNESDLSLFATHVLEHGQTININAGASSSHASDRETFASAVSQTALDANRSYLMFDYNRYFGDRNALFYQLDASVNHDGITGESAPSLSAFLKHDLPHNATLFVSAGVGSNLALIPNPGNFALPNQVEYDCSTQTAIATAPNDLPDVPHGYQGRFGGTLRLGAYTLSAQAYDRRYTGVTLSQALVPASLEPVGFAPSNVLNGIVTGFSTFGGCGAPKDPTIYFQHDVSGATVDYRGIELAGGGHVGSRTLFQVLIDEHRSRLLDNSPLLQGALSSYIPGSEIPATPAFTGSASIAYALNRRTRLLLNDTYTGINNQQHLPAYHLLTAGIVGKLSRHLSYTVVATNIGHAFTGAFISNRYAIGIPTIGGTPFVPLAAPLTIPQLYVALHFRDVHLPTF